MHIRMAHRGGLLVKKTRSVHCTEAGTEGFNQFKNVRHM